MKPCEGNEKDQSQHARAIGSGLAAELGHNGDYVTDCKKCQRKIRARKNRQSRESAMRDLGLVKVRGALGGMYWGERRNDNAI